MNFEMFLLKCISIKINSIEKNHSKHTLVQLIPLKANTFNCTDIYSSGLSRTKSHLIAVKQMNNRLNYQLINSIRPLRKLKLEFQCMGQLF